MKKFLIVFISCLLLITGCNAVEKVNEKLSRGIIEGDTYTLEYFDVAFTLPEGFVFFSEEEIAAAMGQVIEADEDLGAWLEENAAASIVTMYAVDETGLNSINVVVQSDASLRAAGTLGEEGVIDAIIPELPEQYAAAGMEAEVSKVQKTFLGETHFGIFSNLSFSGLNYETLQFYIFHGSYMACITFSSYEEGGSEAYVDSFYPLS